MPQNSRYLCYKASFVSAAAIFMMSMFSQWLNWYIYEKMEYGWGYMLLTPLILCFMYHFVQMDAGKHGNFSRRFFFLFSVALPLIFSTAVTVLLFIFSPELSIFDSYEEYSGNFIETIAIYAGRIMITSVYLLIFAVIDIPLLKKSEEKEKDE